jgi:hypothetical protein
MPEIGLIEHGDVFSTLSVSRGLRGSGRHGRVGIGSWGWWQTLNLRQ